MDIFFYYFYYCQPVSYLCVSMCVFCNAPPPQSIGLGLDVPPTQTPFPNIEELPTAIELYAPLASNIAYLSAIIK